MGRLFWKFFLFLLVSQIATTLTVGIALSLLQSREYIELTQSERSRMARPDPPGRSSMTSEANSAPSQSRSPPPPHGWQPTILPLLTGSVISLIFAAAIAWYFSHPISSLRTAFAALSEGQLEARTGESLGTRKDELADLGQDFDRMAAQLEKLVQGQQRLLHDVSHEMRSPLARLQIVVGLMRQQPQRSIELLNRIERESDRMDRLVGELLTLARLDAGLSISAMGEIDLRDLLVAIAEDATFEARQKECAVQLSSPRSLPVRGSPALLSRAFENIIRNAVAHSARNKRVVVTSEVNPVAESVEIEIMDEGSGVAEVDLNAIFQPFFRIDTGRREGYGLGLSIAKRVIEGHGGSIAASNRKTGGLSMRIRLPMTTRRYADGGETTRG